MASGNGGRPITTDVTYDNVLGQPRHHSSDHHCSAVTLAINNTLFWFYSNIIPQMREASAYMVQ